MPAAPKSPIISNPPVWLVSILNVCLKAHYMNSLSGKSRFVSAGTNINRIALFLYWAYHHIHNERWKVTNKKGFCYYLLVNCLLGASFYL